MVNKMYKINEVSETAFLIKFNEKFSTDLSLYIARCAEAITAHFKGKFLNTIPSYDGLLINFKPHVFGDFLSEIENVISTVKRKDSAHQSDIIEIPAYYDLEVAESLNDILEATSMDLETLIKIHTEKPFFVYMIGFCPGFGYMGDLPPQMHLPRLKTPQLKIPVGSVAIAEFQTAIYPIEMPGGWHIIGRTPLKMFDANRENTSLFKQGDMVQFRAIDREEFIALGGQL